MLAPLLSSKLGFPSLFPHLYVGWGHNSVWRSKIDAEYKVPAVCLARA